MKVDGPSKQLSARQELAIRALLTTPTHEAAAKVAGISTVTLWRFMKQAEFRQAYQEARSQLVGDAVSELQRSSLKAVKTLDAISANEAAAPTARVSAAKAILEMGFRAADAADVSARLDALEELNRGLPKSES